MYSSRMAVTIQTQKLNENMKIPKERTTVKIGQKIGSSSWPVVDLGLVAVLYTPLQRCLWFVTWSHPDVSAPWNSRWWPKYGLNARIYMDINVTTTWGFCKNNIGLILDFDPISKLFLKSCILTQSLVII